MYIFHSSMIANIVDKCQIISVNTLKLQAEDTA